MSPALRPHDPRVVHLGGDTEYFDGEAEREDAIADMDHGIWTGRTFDALAAEDPAPLTEWFADPTRAAPGGETMEAVRIRVGAWLDGCVNGPTPLLAVTHATVLRAAIAHVLAVPVAATLAIDVAPLALLTLSHNGRWRLRELAAA